MLKKIILLSLVFIVLLSFNSLALAQWKPDIKSLKIAGYSPGGFGYIIVARWADEIKKTFPDLWATASTGTSIPNAKLLNKNEVQAAIGVGKVLADSFEGKGTFFEGTPQNNIRFLGTVMVTALHFVVRANSNIYHITDLKNKSINVGKKGMHMNVTSVLESFGITLDSIIAKGGKVHYVTYGEAKDLFSDGHTDCLTDEGCPPYPSVIELAPNIKLRLLSFTDEEIKKILQHPYLKGNFIPAVIPKESYSFLKENVKTIAGVHALYVHKDLSEELVYRITKILWENPEMRKIFKEGVPSEFGLNIKNALLGKGEIPVHMGALRYYKEVGLPIEK